MCAQHSTQQPAPHAAQQHQLAIQKEFLSCQTSLTLILIDTLLKHSCTCVTARSQLQTSSVSHLCSRFLPGHQSLANMPLHWTPLSRRHWDQWLVQQMANVVISCLEAVKQGNWSLSPVVACVTTGNLAMPTAIQPNCFLLACGHAVERLQLPLSQPH